MGTESASSSELMVIRAAQELRDHEVVFVGIGLPNVACNLARLTHAPDLFLIYESGAVGAVPERLPVSIGDPSLVTDSLAVVRQSDVFHQYLQGGLIEVGFLGGAQIDRFGNINTTVIGEYDNPSVRLPGSGGACEIAVHSQRVLILMEMNRRRFVERCDFVTSPGHRLAGGRFLQSQQGRGSPIQKRGQGPVAVITDLGVCRFEDGEMTLTEIYPGVSEETVRKSCGWPLRIADELRVTPAPSPTVVSVLRRLLPSGLYVEAR